MAKKYPLVVPDNRFIADSLEELAEHVSGEEGVILREAASLSRRFPMRHLIHVQEEEEDVNQAAARVVREATKD